MPRALVAVPLSLVAAGCMAGGAAVPTAAPSSDASASLVDAAGAPRGLVTLVDGPPGLTLHVAAEGLPPGTHGIHIHTVGRCDAPDFQTAGGHWNPAMKQHGRDNPQGAHSGD